VKKAAIKIAATFVVMFFELYSSEAGFTPEMTKGIANHTK
tara:strand:+ start:168 stop:287 length:120 start_codon:yes stop_codon:yes gene_type:complete